MKLQQEFTIRVDLEQPSPVGPGPIGTRMYYDIIGGEISGERVSGKVLGGGEWGLIGPDGYLRVDVRLQVETDDGAFLYIQYFGYLELNDAVMGAMQDESGTSFEDQAFYTNPRVETGDERYSWLNHTFFIGRGRILSGGGVEYQVWRPA